MARTPHQEHNGIIPAYAGSTFTDGELLTAKKDHPRIRGEHGVPEGGFEGADRIIPAYAGSTAKRSVPRDWSGDHPRIRGEHLRSSSAPSGMTWIIPAYAGSTPLPRMTETPDSDYPRIRGEHSLLSVPSMPMFGSSPHTRGARFVETIQSGALGIIPAYAGSTGEEKRLLRWVGDHPRIRGEHSDELKSAKIVPGSSPHTRGARRRRRRHHRTQGIIPAYAGSTPLMDEKGAGAEDHPRIRGEHVIKIGADLSAQWIIPAYAGSTPPGGAGTGLSVGSSPHTRGAPDVAEGVPVADRIIPAYAGSTRSCRAPPGRYQDHPRIRGEHRVGDGAPLGGDGIIPAYAGSTALTSDCSSPGRDHPRIRGEHVGGQIVFLSIVGSSPHTRGAPGPVGVEPAGAGIIPAYAGSTCERTGDIMAAEDHPRIRGEHVQMNRAIADGSGSSPHTRGAPIRGLLLPRDRRIIPAYAGSTTTYDSFDVAVSDHPRIRGEHCRHRGTGIPGAGSSPHTRGARSAWSAPSSSPRIIPAYAGSTTRRLACRSSRWDHPRIRGEHPRTPRNSARWRGSSPHTRGARSPGVLRGPLRGIIPAYAGSTPVSPTPAPSRPDHPRIRGEHGFRILPLRRQDGSSPHTRGALPHE